MISGRLCVAALTVTSLCSLGVALHRPAEPAPRVRIDIDEKPVDGDRLIARDHFYRRAKHVAHKLDSGRELTGLDLQILSMAGREDLAAREDSPRFGPCDALPGGDDPLVAIERAARETSIVIINEAHDRARHRDFIEDVATRLRPLGYETFAGETFSNSPWFEPRPDEPYLRESDGYYSREVIFGRELRAIKALGYTLVPYEQRGDQSTNPPDIADQINEREEAQATNLMEAIFEANPKAKVLIHVGYDHAVKTDMKSVDGRALRWMAARLWEKTGIEPVTIDQTFCHGAPSARLARSTPRQRSRSFDLMIDHPVPEHEQGRDAWRFADGDIATPIPPEVMPGHGWSLIEARMHGEPDHAIPVDRVLVRHGHDVVLALPPGRYRVRSVPLWR